MATTKTTQTAKNKLNDTAEAVKERAAQATETAKSAVNAKVGEAKARVESEANSRISAFADSVSAKARQLDDAAGQMAEDYPHTRATRQAAEFAHQAADRIRETDVQRLLRDVQDAARKHPIMASVAAVATGAAVGRFLKARARDLEIDRVATYRDPRLDAPTDRIS